MHIPTAAATLPVRSAASYPYLISSVKAKTPAPAAPVAAAVKIVARVLGGFGMRLEWREELVVE